MASSFPYNESGHKHPLHKHCSPRCLRPSILPCPHLPRVSLAQPGGSAGSSPCCLPSPCLSPPLRSLCCSRCHIWVQNKARLLTLVCMSLWWECGRKLITFGMYLWKSQSLHAGICMYNIARKAIKLPRRGHSAEALCPCRTTSRFDLLCLSCYKTARVCHLIPVTTIWSPFLLFMLLRYYPLVFLGIPICSSSEKYPWKYAKETLHKPRRCIMWRHLAVIKWGDYSKAHHFPLLFTSSWFPDLLVYTL